MHKVPAITRLIFLPGLSAGSIGLVLDDDQVVWGDCARSALTPPFSDLDAQTSIEQVVAPALVGSKLGEFRKLAGIIENLTESVTREESIPEPEKDDRSEGISRRALLTGRIRAETPPPSPSPTRLVTSEQPLHPAIRYGVSQALLAAVALTQNRSMAELLTDEYDLPRPTTTVPLHAQLDTDQPLESLPQPSPHIESLGYTVPKGDPAEILGANGVILQRFLRILKDKVVATPGWEHHPALHIDLRGGLGQLYGRETGKMLGALYGLEQAAKPLPLRIENAIDHANAGDSASLIAELQSYIRMRNMQVDLVAGDIDTLETARFFAQADAYPILTVTPARLGGLAQSAEAVLACRANGKRIILSADSGDSVGSLQVLSQVALGLQADFVGVSSGCDNPTLVYGEMGRVLVEMGVQG